MNGREMFMDGARGAAGDSPPGPRGAVRGRRGRETAGVESADRRLHFRALGEIVNALDHDPLVRGKTRRDRDAVVLGRTSAMRRMVTVRSSFTTYTNVPNDARCTAADGITVASGMRRTRSRMLTNWFGNSWSSALSNRARSLIEPVVVSIWLSTVCTPRW